MRPLRIILTLVCVLYATAGFGAKTEKDAICHVGNEYGPQGQTYDPYCEPTAEYDCSADAGKIDLIMVGNTKKHLNNESHSFEGVSDYLPETLNASGIETWDSNGDGIDDGCEPGTPSNKEVFVSSQTFTGDLVTEAADLSLGEFDGDGLAAGDAICTHLAGEAGLTGSWSFWGSTDTVDAKDRVTVAVPFFLTDGTTQVGDSLADILDCANPSCLDAAITKDENGFDATGQVMTGTAPDGTAFSGGIRTCGNWTSALERFVAPECSPDDSLCRVMIGIAGQTIESWTQAGAQYSCHESRRIYCFQD